MLRAAGPPAPDQRTAWNCCRKSDDPGVPLSCLGGTDFYICIICMILYEAGYAKPGGNCKKEDYIKKEFNVQYAAVKCSASVRYPHCLFSRGKLCLKIRYIKSEFGELAVSFAMPGAAGMALACQQLLSVVLFSFPRSFLGKISCELWPAFSGKAFACHAPAIMTKLSRSSGMGLPLSV